MRTATPILSLALLTPLACAQLAIDASHAQTPQPMGDTLVWSHFAGSAKHSRVPSAATPPSLIAPAWSETTYIPIPQSGLVVDHDRVYAIAADPARPGAALAIAYERFTGDLAWTTPVPAPLLDSWSTPALDLEHNRLIIASGTMLTALDTDSGDPAWSTDIGSIIVNASPVVTDDLGEQDRVFITNYSFGGGGAAKLTCINTDPFHAVDNPHHPGDIVWQAPLDGDSSGNSPAYNNGVVFVATASSTASTRGKVLAFDATAASTPSPLWTFTNTNNTGFFGSVTIAKGHAYASSYSYSGLQYSANTVKLNKQTGALVWSVPTNRTDAAPIVLPDGDILVSSGLATGAFDFLPFFGSLPSIQYIDDAGTSASVRWDSALATLDDRNANGFWDFGEPFLSIGGWTHQPIALTINTVPHLLVGTLPESRPGVNTDHNTDLRLIDLTLAPNDPGFIIDHFAGAGSTPAYARGWIYTTGPAGIAAFAPAPTPPLLRARDLADQYTNGEITLPQLMERLRR